MVLEGKIGELEFRRYGKTLQIVDVEGSVILEIKGKKKVRKFLYKIWKFYIKKPKYNYSEEE